MGKYRKKPVVIEAFKYEFENRPDWFTDKITLGQIVTYAGIDPHDCYCEIRTLEGIMKGDFGDFIIQGVNGEIYPCKPDIFFKTYEKFD